MTKTNGATYKLISGVSPVFFGMPEETLLATHGLAPDIPLLSGTEDAKLCSFYKEAESGRNKKICDDYGTRPYVQKGVLISGTRFDVNYGVEVTSYVASITLQWTSKTDSESACLASITEQLQPLSKKYGKFAHPPIRHTSPYIRDGHFRRIADPGLIVYTTEIEQPLSHIATETFYSPDFSSCTLAISYEFHPYRHEKAVDEHSVDERPEL